MSVRFAVLITLVAFCNLPVSAQRRLAQPRPLTIENPEERQALQAKAPPEQRQQYYEQAVWKAVGAQDLAQARRLIEENFPNPQQRSHMLANLERNEINRRAGPEKYEEARLLLARLPAVDERLHLLTQWANALAQKGDEQTARRLLAEAQALLGNGVETRTLVEQQLIFATSLLKLNAARSFESPRTSSNVAIR